jgi:hypothetical protein
MQLSSDLDSRIEDHHAPERHAKEFGRLGTVALHARE